MSPLIFAYGALAAALGSGLVALGADRYPALLRYAAFPVLGLSGAAAVAAGGWALLAKVALTATLPLGLPWLPWHLRLDPLSGFFFLLVGILVVAVSLYGPGYVREYSHGKGRQSLAPLGLFTGLFVASMLFVLLADDAFAFMVGWEGMSLSSYFLVAYQHQYAAHRRAAFLYLLMAQIGGLAILLAFGVLAASAGGFGFAAMRAAHPSGLWASIAFALAFFGFGLKAGMVPGHAWLPEAHPAAPSHISALMSGAMLKVAIYGLIRFSYDLLGPIQWQWGLAVLLFGTVSAVLGVLYALVQNDLKRLLAYSSIENIGIILIALGLSMIFIGTGHPVLGVLGLLAALYHAINHALFKGLLFLGAGAVLHACHETDLNRMGGLIRRMPKTALLVLIGCLAISALPPLNGFVSEWLTFQTALQVPSIASGVLRSIIPVTAALLALSGALAAATFVKVYGIAFLGLPRTRRVGHAREVDAGMLSGMGLLAVLCILFGVFPTPVVGAVGIVPETLLHLAPPNAAGGGWLWLTPVSPAVASYSAPLVVAGIVLVTALGALAMLRWRAGMRRAEPWDCGYGGLSARTQITATAFAMPIRRVFAPAWDVEETVEESAHPSQPLLPSAIRHQLHIEDRSWPRLYEPLGRLILGAARRIGAIQGGSIRAYLAYSFFTLILLLWLVT